MPYKNPEHQAEYRRKHYLANREKYIAMAKARVAKDRRARRDIIRAAKNVPCTDCGLMWPSYVMQFDHVGTDKEFNIGDHTKISVGIKRLLREIAKCEVVCANCHAIRTHDRATCPAEGVPPTGL